MEPPPDDQRAGDTSSSPPPPSNSIANNDDNEATTYTTAKTLNNQAGQQPLEGFPDGWTKRRRPINTAGTGDDTYHYYSPLEQHTFHSSKYI